MRRVAFAAEPSPSALRALNYNPAVEAMRRASVGRSVPLRDLLATMGPAYGSVFTRLDCAPEHGVELVTQSDMFAAEPSGRVIRKDSMPHPDRHLIQKWDVLVAGAGTLGETELYGRALIADERLAGKFTGPHSMTLRFLEPNSDQALFTYAFLASRTGLDALRSTSYGTKILGLRTDLLGAMPIPSVDSDTAKRVADQVRLCVTGRETYLRELHAARKVIEDLPEMTEAGALCAERTRRAVSWSGPLPSLRAWNFAHAGPAQRTLAEAWPCALTDWLIPGGLFKGGRAERIPCRAPWGINFVSQRDVFSIRPIPRRVRAPREDLSVVPEDLLLASRGQLSEGALFAKVERASNLPDGWIVTEDITRLRAKAAHADTLHALLSTRPMQELLRGTAYGTSIPGMREDLVGSLPVPDPLDARLSSAGELAARASAARTSAARAETEAIRIVEEEVLSQWLK